MPKDYHDTMWQFFQGRMDTRSHKSWRVLIPSSRQWDSRRGRGDFQRTTVVFVVQPLETAAFERLAGRLVVREAGRLVCPRYVRLLELVTVV